MEKNGFFQNHLRNLSFVTKKITYETCGFVATSKKKRERTVMVTQKNNKKMFSKFLKTKSQKKKLSKNTLNPENNSVQKMLPIFVFW